MRTINKSNIKTIAIDMDQVITDTLAKQIEVYNAYFKANITKEDLMGKSLRELAPLEDVVELYALVNTKGFFRDLKFIEDNTAEVIKSLAEKYDVYICTAAMEVPNSFEDKYEWLRENLPFLDRNKYIFCGYKGIIGTDVLIDDNINQLRDIKGIKILYTAPHNINTDNDFIRVNSWNDVAELFL